MVAIEYREVWIVNLMILDKRWNSSTKYFLECKSDVLIIRWVVWVIISILIWCLFCTLTNERFFLHWQSKMTSWGFSLAINEIFEMFVENCAEEISNLKMSQHRIHLVLFTFRITDEKENFLFLRRVVIKWLRYSKVFLPIYHNE